MFKKLKARFPKEMTSVYFRIPIPKSLLRKWEMKMWTKQASIDECSKTPTEKYYKKYYQDKVEEFKKRFEKEIKKIDAQNREIIKTLKQSEISIDPNKGLGFMRLPPSMAVEKTRQFFSTDMNFSQEIFLKDHPAVQIKKQKKEKKDGKSKSTPT